MRSLCRKHILREGKRLMWQSELSQQRGCDIYLRAIGVDAHRTFHRPTAEDERNMITEVGVVVVILQLRIHAQMIGHKHDERILPQRRSLHAADEGAETTVGISESIESHVGESMIRHIVRLMTAARLYHFQERLFRRLTQVIEYFREQRAIGCPPFADAQSDRGNPCPLQSYRSRR
jgi:hypothetical protein